MYEIENKIVLNSFYFFRYIKLFVLVYNVFDCDAKRNYNK